MSWSKVSDDFFLNRKVQAALAMPQGKSAVLLYLSSLTYSSSQLTDGSLTAAEVRVAAGLAHVSPRVGGILIEVGLWETAGDAVLIHDYLAYNPCAEEVKERRAWATARSSMHRDSNLIAAVRDRDGNRCRYCGAKVRWTDRRGPAGATYDHVIPRGPNTVENLVVACRRCNTVKGGRTPEEAGMPLLENKNGLDPT